MGTAKRMTAGLISELYCTVKTKNISTIAIPMARTTCACAVRQKARLHARAHGDGRYAVSTCNHSGLPLRNDFSKGLERNLPKPAPDGGRG